MYVAQLRRLENLEVCVMVGPTTLFGKISHERLVPQGDPPRCWFNVVGDKCRTRFDAYSQVQMVSQHTDIPVIVLK